MKKLFNIYLILVVVIFAACDIIEPPYTDGDGPTPIDDTVVRKVILEEYTGHLCINCPTAAVKAHELKALYGDKMILMTIHAGYYAGFSSPNYMTDYTTSVGDDLDNFFMASAAVPCGLVNRKEFSGSYILQSSSWGSKIAELLATNPDADINIIRTFNSGTSTVDLNTRVDFFSEISNPIMISAYLTEDSIIDYQKNNNSAVGTTPDITNYNHMHILRGPLNGTWGDTLSATGAMPGNQIITTISGAVTNSAWDKEHMHVVVFIYDAVTFEMIQAEEIKLK